MGTLVLNGATSGSTTLQPTDAVTATITLPPNSSALAGLTTPSFTSTIGVGGATPASSGAGITFPATQNAASDANTLDDYEEGTWTPNVGGNATFTGRGGDYTKIGNLVYIRCLIQISVLGTGSTQFIYGLPFAPAAGASNRNALSISYFGGLSKTVVFLGGNVEGGQVGFIGTTAASANVTDGIAIFQNNAYVIFSAVYQTST